MTDRNEMENVQGDLNSEDVYVATLVLRSVGNNRAIIPETQFSHFLDGTIEQRMDNDQMPYSYIALMQIAEKINAVMQEVPAELQDDLPEDLNEAAKVLSALSDKPETKKLN